MSAFTVATEISQAQFVWTGVETSFPCGFAALSATHLLVQETSAGPVTQTLVMGVHYSVAIDPSSGAVTVVPIAIPVTPGTITVTRNTPATQGTQFNNLDPYQADAITLGLDAGAMRDAELKRRVAVLEGAQPTVPGAYIAVVATVTAVRKQRQIAGAGDLPIRSDDDILNLVLAAPLVIPLPTAASRGGRMLSVKDWGHTTGTNNASLRPAGELIDQRAGDLVLRANGAAANLTPANDGVNSGWGLE